jgi:lipopolysaccharide exporter
VESSQPKDQRSDLQRQAARAVPWTLISYAANKAVTVLTTIVLARLLTPRDFGLVAIATLIVGVVALFSRAGLGNALILRQEQDRLALATAFSIMLALGVAGAAICALAAPLLARAFDTPSADVVIAASAAALAYSGVAGFYEALLQRELRARAMFVCQALQTVLYAAIAIPLAAAGAGVWSLVVGGLASSAAFALAVVIAARSWLWPRWNRSAASDFWQTGRGFLFQNVFWFASANVDYAVVARYSGAANLGAYTMAYRLVEVPNLAIADPVAQVSFPSFARMRARGLEVQSAYLRVLGLIALAACPLALLLSASADPFVAAVLGSSWESAVTPLTVLGIAGAFLPLSATAGWLLNSVGEPMTSARISGVTFLLFIAPLIIAAMDGIVAVAVVMLVRAVLTYAIILVATARRAGVGVGRQLAVLRGVAPGCAAAWAATYGVASALDGSPAGVALAASVAVGLAVYVAVVAVLDRSILPAAIGQVRLALLGRE